MKKVSAKRVLYVSLLVDIIDIVINILVAILTGSVIMLTEALQGIVDAQSVALLTVGEKHSHKRASKLHPFGFGKELYFWSTLATFVMLAITATISFYFGWKQFWEPSELENLHLALIVLTISFFTNMYALILSVKKLMEGKHWQGILEKFKESTDIIAKTTIVLDFIGILMALIGFTALLTAHVTGDSSLDGLGAMIIAVFLGLMSLVLLANIRSLVVGQSADKKTLQTIYDVVSSYPDVKEVVELRTMIMGADILLINMHVKFRKAETARQIASTINSIEAKISAAIPGKHYINIEPEL